MDSFHFITVEGWNTPDTDFERELQAVKPKIGMLTEAKLRRKYLRRIRIYRRPECEI